MIEPPYPKDLEAKGWSLDLEYERIARSNTWAIASAEQRPWLLMVWLMSWQQAPVASLPSEDKFIAAHIGMPLEQFMRWRDVLLCGWEQANDGRLYHKTLTEHVLKMAGKRVKDAARVRAYREKMASSNSEQAVCNALHERDSLDNSEKLQPGTTPTPTPTLTLKEKNTKKKSASALVAARPDDVSESVWASWLALRAKNKATACETALEQARREAAKAGLDLEEFLRLWVGSGYRGFKADWIKSGSGVPRQSVQDAIDAAGRMF